MRKHLLLFIIGLSMTAFAACDATNDTTDQNSDTDTNADEQQDIPAREATYRGTVEPAGASMYMQGTHRLELADGGFILLESSAVDVSAYEGRDVIAQGLVRETVEAGGLIMTVESISSFADTSASSSEGENASEESSVSESTADSSVSSESTHGRTSSSGITSEPDSAAAEVMAADNMDAANWTQRYCSSHMGFCIPIHRNWWFKSFGATSSTLWHVEVGPEEILELGEGPLTVNVVSGSISSGEDGSVDVEGETVVGRHSWTDDRHLEIRAPAALEDAIRYMITNIEKAPEPDED